ncbi:hypothetical protein Fmac_000756 [Flemingia macrophylla]|uniref:Uncharacterized protein n=1 Tax=Flemingia macrophylla TaxID=520843 RepID=A0ABD1NFN5_9FABA
MVALEQCHYPYESYITDYVVVLGLIGKTSRDVDILSRFRVLINFLGNNDRVAAMFNDLGTTITAAGFNSSYILLCRELDVFCRNPRHKLMAALRRWQGVASVGGIVIPILTFFVSFFVCIYTEV